MAKPKTPQKSKQPQKSDTTNVVSAGAAGGGLGTVVAAIANGLQGPSAYKSILTVGAPLIAVGVSGLWLFIKGVYIDPYVAKKKHETADAAMDSILANARANAEKVLNDPTSSDEHKKEVKKMVEDLERLRLMKITERMEVVAAD